MNMNGQTALAATFLAFKLVLTSRFKRSIYFKQLDLVTT